MNDFPSNSNATKKGTKSRGREAPEIESVDKKLTKIVVGDVVRKKTPWYRQFREMFIQGSSQSVTEYVVMDVIVPSIKDMISQSVSEGIEKLLFRDSPHAPSSRGRGRMGGGQTNYGGVYRQSYSDNRRGVSEERPMSRRSRAVHNFDEITLETRAEAEAVLDRLFDLVSRYETATVADLYELVGVSGSYTDDKYGWYNLEGSQVSRVRGGYLLDLPRPEPID